MASKLSENGVLYDQPKLRDKVRALVGQVSKLILTDDIADGFLEDARVEICNRKKLKAFRSFKTQAGKQRYDIFEANFPANFLGHPEGFWQGGAGGGCAGLPFPGAFSDPWTWIVADIMQNQGSLVRVNQPAIDRMFKELSYLQDRFGGKAWWGPDERLWLTPVPTADGVDVYYFVPVPRFAAVLDVDDRYRSPFFSYVEFRAATFMAGRQSEVGSWKHGNGDEGSTAAGARYEKQAARAEARFDQAMSHPGGATPMRARP